MALFTMTEQITETVIRLPNGKYRIVDAKGKPMGDYDTQRSAQQAEIKIKSKYPTFKQFQRTKKRTIKNGGRPDE
jgi:DNA anti-recombination protein RmuC